MNYKLFLITLLLLSSCVTTKSKWGDDSDKPVDKPAARCDEVHRSLLINLKEKKFGPGSPQNEYRGIVLDTDTGKNYWNFFSDDVCDFSYDEKGQARGCGEGVGAAVVGCIQDLGARVAQRHGVNQEFLFFLEKTANEAMSNGGALPRSTLRERIDAEISYIKFLRFLSEEMKARKRPSFFQKKKDSAETEAVTNLARIEALYEKEFTAHLRQAAIEHYALVSEQRSLSPEDEADLRDLGLWMRHFRR